MMWTKEAVLERVKSSRIVLIDGPSGSGKTTLANYLAEQSGFQLVHLDDFYPGWSGLEAASKMVVSDVLDPINPHFTRWDWVRNRPAEVVRLQPDEPMIIEGVGALTQQSVQAAKQIGTTLTIYVELPAELRKQRALRRDPEFAAWWDMWAKQEEKHFSDCPRADIRV